MKLEVQEDVLKVRAGRTSNSNEPADADADGNADEDDAERSSLWIGIAHLLTPARINEVRACRARCTRAVLTGEGKGKSKGKAGSLSRSRTWLGGYCLCLISPDKKGHVESNEAWKVSPRSSERSCRTTQEILVHVL